MTVARTANRARGRRLTLTRSSYAPRTLPRFRFLLRPSLSRLVRPVPRDELSVLHVPSGFVARLPCVAERLVRGLVLPGLHLLVRLPLADHEVAAVDHRAAVVRPDVAGLLLAELVHRFEILLELRLVRFLDEELKDRNPRRVVRKALLIKWRQRVGPIVGHRSVLLTC